MSKKLTPWFPPNVKPVHEGAYLVKFGDGSWSEDHAYAYFRAGLWSYGKASPDAAMNAWDYYTVALQNKQWRGLAKNPATKDAEVSNG